MRKSISKQDISVRPFTRRDVPQLLSLMRGLAKFEGYIDAFEVTEEALLEHGLGHDPKFEAVVAHEEDKADLLGMAVLYAIPWTYDLRPNLVLKELYVDESARGMGVGAALFEAVARRARVLNCSRVLWTVLKGNGDAERFYRQQGGAPDPLWDSWTLDRAAITRMAAP